MKISSQTVLFRVGMFMYIALYKIPAAFPVNIFPTLSKEDRKSVV